MALIKAEDIKNMKEEQIWGPKTPFYEKKLYRDDKIAINLRRVPPREKIQSEGGYQLHTHDDSTEIVIVLKGKGVGYCGSDGELSHQAGDILIIPPNTEHGSVSVEEEWTALAIFIPPPKERY